MQKQMRRSSHRPKTTLCDIPWCLVLVLFIGACCLLFASLLHVLSLSGIPIFLGLGSCMHIYEAMKLFHIPQIIYSVC
jgi:hypothetical protein